MRNFKEVNGHLCQYDYIRDGHSVQSTRVRAFLSNADRIAGDAIVLQDGTTEATVKGRVPHDQIVGCIRHLIPHRKQEKGASQEGMVKIEI